LDLNFLLKEELTGFSNNYFQASETNTTLRIKSEDRRVKVGYRKQF